MEGQTTGVPAVLTLIFHGSANMPVSFFLKNCPLFLLFGRLATTEATG